MFNQATKPIQWRKESLSNIWTSTWRQNKTKFLNPYFILYTKINLKMHHKPKYKNQYYKNF